MRIENIVAEISLAGGKRSGWRVEAHHKRVG